MALPPNYGTTRGVVDFLRSVLRGNEVFADSTPDDIMFWVKVCYQDEDSPIKFTQKKACEFDGLVRVTSARFVGPGYAQDNNFDPLRVTVIVGRTQDGRGVVEDVTLG